MYNELVKRASSEFIALESFAKMMTRLWKKMKIAFLVVCVTRTTERLQFVQNAKIGQKHHALVIACTSV